ncbi:MAG TPA: GNAT family N-acetyltransferase [Gammaproteobacteria bacterium]|nr:GNAT family N-acetyltransferase [Gammaproteobacteria bacterium]
MTATATTTHAFHVRLADWAQDRAQLQAVREAVFVREQNIPAELEWDEAVDRTCIHVLALDHANRPIGTARLKPDGQIGRMAVLAPWRRRGVGRTLLDALLAVAREHRIDALWLNAQAHTMGFYIQLGFRPTGEPFHEAGIVHRRMIHTAATAEDPPTHARA